MKYVTNYDHKTVLALASQCLDSNRILIEETQCLSSKLSNKTWCNLLFLADMEWKSFLFLKREKKRKKKFNRISYSLNQPSHELKTKREFLTFKNTFPTPIALPFRTPTLKYKAAFKFKRNYINPQRDHDFRGYATEY